MLLAVFMGFALFSVALLIAGYYAFSVPQQQAEQAVTLRLRELRSRSGKRTRSGSDLLRTEHRGTFAFLGDFVAWLGVLRRLQVSIDQADRKHRAADVLALSILIAIAVWLLAGFAGLGLALLRLLLAVIAGGVPVFLILRARARRLSKFEENFPDAIDLFNRSMKAGHTIHSGLETIGNEAVEPVRMEFKKVIEELALGSPIEDALHNLGKRVPLIDLKFFITGLILQRQTGANMVEVLDNLGLLVRERLNVMAKMKAHTAQQRFSAALLCAMPIVFALGLWFVKPEYLTLLYTDSTGSALLTYAIVSEIVGILIIRKIANPRF
jgi:tight adherence protein B